MPERKWIKVTGIVIKGYRVASGQAKNSPYPAGSIKLQIPFFLKRGLDLSPFYPGTINVSIKPYEFKIRRPLYSYTNVRWLQDIPGENFSFFSCRIIQPDNVIQGLIYYPHPETKTMHYQDNSTLEILAPFIKKII